jgi:hypothetical protein
MIIDGVSVTAAVLARDHFDDASGPSAASIEDHIRQVLHQHFELRIENHIRQVFGDLESGFRLCATGRKNSQVSASHLTDKGEPAQAFWGLQQFIGLNLKLGYFGLTGDSNAMLPIRIMFEKDAVSLCGAVDVWLQLFHLALLNGRDVYWAAP